MPLPPTGPPPAAPAAPPPVVEPPGPGTQTVTRGFDLTHSFHSADAAGTPPLGLAWGVKLGGYISSPLIADGRVFVSVSRRTGYGVTVVALDARTGKKIWRAPFDDAVYFSAALGYGQGRLVAVFQDGVMRAFDPATGTVQWTTTTGSSGGYPLIVDSLIYVQGNGSVEAFDVATGAKRFAAGLGDGTDGIPAVSGDRLYALGPCVAGAFDRRDGRTLWRLDDQGCTGGGGDVARLFKRRVIGDEYHLDAETGARIEGGAPVDAVAGDVGVRYVEEGIQARDLTSGSVLWTAHPPAEASGPSLAVAVARETVLWRNGYLLTALDLQSGKATWLGYLPSTSTGAPDVGGIDQDLAIGDGIVAIPMGYELIAVSSTVADPPPRITLRKTSPVVVYGGRFAIRGRVVSRGLAARHRVVLAMDGVPLSGLRPVARRSVARGHRFRFTPRPSRNSRFEVRVRGGRKTKQRGVVVVPRVTSRRLDRSPGSYGRMLLRVRVPAGVNVDGATIGLYLNRRGTRTYVRLGAGQLQGGRGHYRATVGFRVIDTFRPGDAVAICVRGIHRKGMSFGDALDRRCGATRVRV